MNRGNIPGFYYDEEKKKYFKIQADRLAPAEAKYARSNVKHEAQESRKRKREERHEKLVRRQTVPASRLLKHSLLGGTGLKREQGFQSYSWSSIQRDAALVNTLQTTRLDCHAHPRYPRTDEILTDALPVPQQSTMLLAFSLGPGCHTISNCTFRIMEADVFDSEDRKQEGERLTAIADPEALYAFHNPTSHLNVMDVNATPVVIACASQPCASVGNVFIAPLRSEDRVSTSATTATYPHTLWDCKVNGADKFALAGSGGAEVFSVGADTRFVTRYDLEFTKEEAFACEWLDRQTLAIGMRQIERKAASHDVLLWDIRSQGAASRIDREMTITGIHKPRDQHLCVSSNYTIDLYDLRILRKDRPLFSLPHKSPSKQLHMSTYGNVLAAVDVTNKVQIHSLATGRHLRTLAPSSNRKGLLVKPRWTEDESTGAPYLQACQGSVIWRWSWQGEDEAPEVSSVTQES